ncbi:hypothetical protein EAG_10851 [Camponotus floridanus]|uniref:Uncharacterized protein n=1 Tax=Camponotus floridanus TaxID=104421 RepID=E2A9J9_CAMFO|nr:hypothetical protein EAG_10851 [Camponotus floridanus]
MGRETNFLPSDCRSSPGPIFGPTELDDGPRPTRPPQPPLSVGASENKYPAVKDRSSRLLERPGRVIASIARSQDTRTDSNIVGFELTQWGRWSVVCPVANSRLWARLGGSIHRRALRDRFTNPALPAPSPLPPPPPPSPPSPPPTSRLYTSFPLRGLPDSGVIFEFPNSQTYGVNGEWTIGVAKPDTTL